MIPPLHSTPLNLLTPHLLARTAQPQIFPAQPANHGHRIKYHHHHRLGKLGKASITLFIPDKLSSIQFNSKNPIYQQHKLLFPSRHLEHATTTSHIPSWLPNQLIGQCTAKWHLRELPSTPSPSPSLPSNTN